jgi:MEMO1 family protein
MVVQRKQHKMQADSRTRPAAVAGLFYPSDADLLRTQVLDLLGDFAASPKVMPKALIAPHAGYVYSGRIAATAFATLPRVVLIGPAHYLHVHGIAAPTVDAFETPLGRVPIDGEALGKIADLPSVIRADAPHAPEHALEVELPFLQTLLGPFQIGAACCRRCRCTGHRPCPATVVGRAGNADRRQLRFIPLS